MQFFQRTFAVTSVIKIYSKVSELCMHPDYDHLHIYLTSTLRQTAASNQHLSRKKKPFSIKPTVVQVKISGKNHQFFRFEISLSLALPAHNSLSHLQLFKVGKIMLLKYGHFMLPSGTFPDKVTPGIDFTMKQQFSVMFQL